MSDNALHRTGHVQREMQPISSESTNMTNVKPTISACEQAFCRIETTPSGQQVLFLVESDETGVPQLMGMTTFMIDQGSLRAPLIFKGPLGGDMSSEQMDAVISGQLEPEALAEMVKVAVEELHAMVLEMIEDGLQFTPPTHVHGEHCNHGHDHEHHQEGAAEANADDAAASPTALPDGERTTPAEKKEGCGGCCATCSCD